MNEVGEDSWKRTEEDLVQARLAFAGFLSVKKGEIFSGRKFKSGRGKMEEEREIDDTPK